MLGQRIKNFQDTSKTRLSKVFQESNPEGNIPVGRIRSKWMYKVKKVLMDDFGEKGKNKNYGMIRRWKEISTDMYRKCWGDEKSFSKSHCYGCQKLIP